MLISIQNRGIEDVTLLDQVQDRGEMDVVDDLVFPLPISVIAELLAVPSSDRKQFRQWSADYIGSDYALHLATAQKIAPYFQRLIEQRRQLPREDLYGCLTPTHIFHT